MANDKEDLNPPVWQNQSKAISFALVFAIFTIPLNYRLGFYSLIALGVVCILVYWKNRIFYRPPFFILCLMAAFAVRVVALAYATNLPYAIARLESESSLVLIPCMFCMFAFDANTQKTFTKAYCLMSIGLVIGTGILTFESWRASGLSISDYLTRHFENPNYSTMTNILVWKWSHYAFYSVILIYGIHIVMWADGLKYKRLWTITQILITTVFVCFTGSTSGIVLLVVALATWGAGQFQIFSLARMSWMFIFCFIAGFAFTLTQYYFKVDQARHDMIQIALEAWKAKPLLGYGTGAGKEIMHNELFEYNYSYSVNHPHNQYFSELIQFGIFGSIPLFSGLLLGLYYAVRHHNKALFALLVTIMLFMIAECPLNTNKGIVPLVMLICFFVKTHQTNAYKTAWL